MSIPKISEKLLPALFDDAHRGNRAPDRRHEHAALAHQFTNEKARFGPWNCRLHSSPDQPIRIVDGQPGVGGHLDAAAVVRVSEIAHIQAGAVIHQYLNDRGGAFGGCAMQGSASGGGL